MPTSGSTTFEPTFDDLLQDAVGMVGGGPILAEELSAAMRGLDYLLIMAQNKNVMLHKIETTLVTLSASTTAYALDSSVLDVQHVGVRTSATGANTITLMRHGYERWAELPTKSNTGRPVAYFFDRRRDSSIMNVWPLPNQDYVSVLTIHKVAETTIRAFNSIDVPRRFIPAMVFGIAYYIGLRRSARVPAERLLLLKAQYDEALRDAMQEDRERGSVYVRIGTR
jgi:hypothetical protein